MKLDSAVLDALPAGLDASQITVSSHGGSDFSSTAKISAMLPDGTEKLFFMKTAEGQDARVMFAGEHESLNALRGAVDGLCPGLCSLALCFLYLRGVLSRVLASFLESRVFEQSVGRIHTSELFVFSLCISMQSIVPHRIEIDQNERKHLVVIRSFRPSVPSPTLCIHTKSLIVSINHLQLHNLTTL